MNYKVLLILISALFVTNCRTAPTADEAKRPLPKFEAADSNGQLVRSDGFAGTPLVIAYFNAESVLAWRTLSELERISRQRGDAQVSLLGIAAAVEPSPEINSLKEEFHLSLPIIVDGDGHLSQLLQVTGGRANQVFFYDRGGRLVSVSRLEEPYSTLAQSCGDLVRDAESSKSANSSLEGRNLAQELTTGLAPDDPGSLPVAGRGLSIVNLFDEFCASCAAGERMDTLNRMAPRLEGKAKIFMILSQDHYSTQDVTNFKKILPVSYPILRGNLHSVEPQLLDGRLLVVLNNEGHAVWRESAGMSEQEIFDSVTHLVDESLR